MMFTIYANYSKIKKLRKISRKVLQDKKKGITFAPQNTKDCSLNLQGQIPEWTNGADCNSAGYAFGGSNPSLPTSFEEADADFSHK